MPVTCDILSFTLGLSVYLVQFTETVVGQAMVFEVSPNIFHRVELRSVWRELLNPKAWVGGSPQLGSPAAMCVEPIPNQNDVPRSGARRSRGNKTTLSWAIFLSGCQCRYNPRRRYGKTDSAPIT